MPKSWTTTPAGSLLRASRLTTSTPNAVVAHEDVADAGHEDAFSRAVSGSGPSSGSTSSGAKKNR